MNKAAPFFYICLLTWTAVACSSGTDAQDSKGDAFGGKNDGTIDCPTGQHDCSGECVSDEPNFPENGCGGGCGQACAAPASGKGEATCGDDGSCSVMCDAGYDAVAGDCVCNVGDTCESLGRVCGPIEDGCGGTVECGTCADGESCNAGQCGSCTEDDAEPNDKDQDASSLGGFTDSPKTSMDFTTFALDSEQDTDWFTATVEDKFGFTNPGNPDIRVDLEGVPQGDVYEIAAWFECNSDGGGSCDEGMEDPVDGAACLATTSTSEDHATVKISTSCNGTNESGTLRVRVRSTTWTASCAPYALRVSVD